MENYTSNMAYYNTLEYIDITQPKSSVLLKTENSLMINCCGTIIATTKNKDEVLPLITHSQRKQFVVSHDSALTKALVEEKGYSLENHCYQTYYPLTEKLPVNPNLTFLPVTMKDKELITKYYHLTNSEYTISRIEDDVMIKLVVENNTVGFIGEHEEGAIGMLEVLPEFRGQGYGTELLKYKVNQYLDKKIIPYSHIIYGNEESIHLHKKLGFKLNTHDVDWLM